MIGEITSHAPAPDITPQFVVPDFSVARETREHYEFGNTVTRNNFTNFLIDGFTKTKGNLSKHAVYLKYLEQNQGIPTNEILTDFLKNGGVKALGEDEVFQIYDLYKSVREHKGTAGTPQDDSFASTINDHITGTLLQINNAGGIIEIDPFRYRIDEFDKSVLSLSKEEFLKWLNNSEIPFTMFHRIGIVRFN